MKSPRLFSQCQRCSSPRKVDEISNEINAIACAVIQESAKGFRLATPGSRMNIRNPDASIRVVT